MRKFLAENVWPKLTDEQMIELSRLLTSLGVIDLAQQFVDSVLNNLRCRLADAKSKIKEA